MKFRLPLWKKNKTYKRPYPRGSRKPGERCKCFWCWANRHYASIRAALIADDTKQELN